MLCSVTATPFKEPLCYAERLGAVSHLVRVRVRVRVRVGVRLRVRVRVKVRVRVRVRLGAISHSRRQRARPQTVWKLPHLWCARGRLSVERAGA